MNHYSIFNLETGREEGSIYAPTPTKALWLFWHAIHGSYDLEKFKAVMIATNKNDKNDCGQI